MWPHKRLIGKLHHYRIGGNTHQWIKSFLSGRSQQVIFEGSQSEKAPVISGVPSDTQAHKKHLVHAELAERGTPGFPRMQGPLLFLLFINDLPSSVSSTTPLFADDAIIYWPIKTSKDCRQLQHDLSLAIWESAWGMSFHPEKCNVLRVTRKRSPVHHIYQLKCHHLEEVSTSKYLGVDFYSSSNGRTI